VNPHRELINEWDSARAAKEHFELELSAASIMYDDAVESLQKEAKQLLLDGINPSLIARAMEHFAPHQNFTKLALKHVHDMVERDQVFVPEFSKEKIASWRTPNREHGLVKKFLGFVKTAKARFELLAAVEMAKQSLDEVDSKLRTVIR
jgi:hypothetical protein